MKNLLKNASTKAKVIGATLVVSGSNLMAEAIPAPDMSDATVSVTNVFGAVLGVAVLIYGFKKVKSLL